LTIQQHRWNVPKPVVAPCVAKAPITKAELSESGPARSGHHEAGEPDQAAVEWESSIRLLSLVRNNKM
jgi:hypothetical protein